MHQVIGLQSRTRRRLEPTGWFGRKTREVEETVYTWTVDGASLTEWIQSRMHEVDPIAPVEETIWLAGNAEDARDRLDRLQGRLPADFDGQRVALLVCPVCGDLGCGAFSAELRPASGTVTWGDLGWEATSSDEPPFLFAPTLSLTFDRDQYTRTLQAAESSLGNG